MTKNVFSRNGGQQNIPVNGIHIDRKGFFCIQKMAIVKLFCTKNGICLSGRYLAMTQNAFLRKVKVIHQDHHQGHRNFTLHCITGTK